MAASTKRSSLPNPNQTQIKPSETQTTKPQERLCDFCGVSKALLYCRADSAKLCFTCDKDVHSTNPLFTKHTRSQLCDSCDSKPASIHCFTENLVLCQNCDWDSHGGGGHDRRPIEGFTGCPSSTELCEILGFKDLGKEELGKKEGFFSGFEDDGMDLNVSGDWLSDLLVWETPSINSLDDLVFESDSRQDFHAMGVPSLPKNRDTACGKYKQTILGQLRDMLKSENSLTTYHKELGSPLVFEPLQLDQNLQSGFSGIECESDAVPIMFPNNEVRGCKWECNSDYLVSSPFSRSCAEESSSVLDKTNDVCSSEQDVNGDHDKQLQHHTMGETPAFLSKHAPQELIHHNRDASLLRYKEKKKTRRYDKHIRYETRKARAESRIRIKGRFAKVVNR